MSEVEERLQILLSDDVEGRFIEAVLKRLDSFGYEVTDADIFLIVFSIQKVYKHIKNECNVSDIPEGLFETAVDMVCGEVLFSKYSFGMLELDTLDLTGAIASITEGSASVSFDNTTSDDAKFRLICQAMMNGGDLACYRKIKW